ncbi:hypothetical protein EEJ42_04830 [Streptomyces botrytidirepellens]|uniref:Uncharacterized protein n=1 Tax=Streptomyces botrytidirepellens TaxID=2486417 RepID=A0A3M8WZ64_9ACTN|nr:hypothetical protein EEJ42_04830 [Streptomyces botrytidirepellens]
MLFDERVDASPQGGPAGLWGQFLSSLQAAGEYGRQEVQRDRGERGGSAEVNSPARALRSVSQRANTAPMPLRPADRDSEQALHRLLRQWQQPTRELHGHMGPRIRNSADIAKVGTAAGRPDAFGEFIALLREWDNVITETAAAAGAWSACRLSPHLVSLLSAPLT